MKRRVSNFAKQSGLNKQKSTFARAKATKLLKEKFGDLFDDLAAVFYEADPMGINAGCNPDEYCAEVGTILPRLTTSCSLQDVENIIYSEFCKWFGDNERDPFTVENVGPRETYQPIAVKVFEMWNDFNTRKVSF